LFLALFLLSLSSPLALAEQPSDVPIKQYVNDYAGVLSSDDIAGLTELLSSIDRNGSAQIAIVTVKNLGGQDIEGFAHQVAEGHLGSTDQNNGLLIIISVEDKKYRFEVGRGLEPYLNDARVGRIGREQLVPAFQEGEYGAGLYNAVLDVQQYLNGDTVATDQSAATAVLSSTEQAFVFFFAAFIALLPIIMVVVLIIAGIIAARTVKNKKTKRSDDRYLKAAMIIVALMGRGRGGGGMGGGGFGGGFSGGGGSFGGGGASGGW
jgi:uncharacterized protein